MIQFELWRHTHTAHQRERLTGSSACGGLCHVFLPNEILWIRMSYTNTEQQYSINQNIPTDENNCESEFSAVIMHTERRVCVMMDVCCEICYPEVPLEVVPDPDTSPQDEYKDCSHHTWHKKHNTTYSTHSSSYTITALANINMTNRHTHMKGFSTTEDSMKHWGSIYFADFSRCEMSMCWCAFWVMFCHCLHQHLPPLQILNYIYTCIPHVCWVCPGPDLFGHWHFDIFPLC